MLVPTRIVIVLAYALFLRGERLASLLLLLFQSTLNPMLTGRAIEGLNTLQVSMPKEVVIIEVLGWFVVLVSMTVLIFSFFALFVFLRGAASPAPPPETPIYRSFREFNENNRRILRLRP
ncbi:MAG TPA: hypothetical protein DIU07_05335 [Rhodobacteraceae bacterium]|nr:hypothetical protein [Paracoccaceae bacterium]